MVKVAVLGGSGYTGVELLRLLAGHPRVRVVAVTSRQAEGQPVARFFPSLTGVCDLNYVAGDHPTVAEADFVFAALPHKAAMEAVVERVQAGQRVIDHSADFRFRDPAAYEAAYGPHLAPELTKAAVYGLAEVHTAAIRTAQVIGNPGCYPTSALLPLVPLLQAGLIETEGIIINSASGVSGAGRALAVTSLMSEVGEDFKAYKVEGHRHRPEIEQELSLAAGRPIKAVFVPHLLPMVRGMLSTIYVRPKAGLDQLKACWTEFYAGRPCVRVLPGAEWPRTVNVRGANVGHLNAALDQPTGQAILLSAIDNLTKGASGQAIQCLNLMAGLDETLGLPLAGLTP